MKNRLLFLCLLMVSFAACTGDISNDAFNGSVPEVDAPVVRPDTCYDGVLNAEEADIDCGAACVACRGGARCDSGETCDSGECSSGQCTEATCMDGRQNGREAGVDCGGFCAPCVDEIPLSQTEVGDVALRRFNRVQYNLVLRELTGLEGNPADGFPIDGSTGGFDTLAVSLTTDDAHARVHAANVSEAVQVAASGAARAQIWVCQEQTSECMQSIWSAFGSRAWRRPLLAEELEQLQEVVATPLLAAGLDWESTVRAGLEALLLSPEFFFRLEVTEEERALSSHELALRLSMFLWSNLPDAALRADADAGRLQDDETLLGHVRRMRADPKARHWIEQFVGQLLETRELGTHEVSVELYPGFTDEVRRAAHEELVAYITRMLRENLPITDLVAGNWTLLNETLANHYEVPSPNAPFSSVVELPRSFGLLGRTAFLTTSSLRERTSVVRRGDTILAQLLCVELMLPDDVMFELAETDPNAEPKSIRERLEQHRAAPECAGCHDHIDPLGFALEGFNAVGQTRTHYEDDGLPIDDSGVFPGHGEFEEGSEVASFLADDPRFHRCLVRQMMSYGVGREMHGEDEVWVKEISDQAKKDRHSLGSIIEGIVLSRPFRIVGVSQ